MNPRTRLLFLGTLPVFGVGLFVFAIALLGFLPGFPGEVFRKLTGVIFTPFFLEATFATLGLLMVFWINYLREKKDGDEFVSLEIPNDSNSQDQ